MVSKPSSIAVILARGGSKRLPGKNLKQFVGKSLIARAVETALDAKCFTSVIVSTDDIDIRAEAILHGASAPFLRPDALSSDIASSFDALVHAVKFYLSSKEAVEFDSACLIQPTSPFLHAKHVQSALKQFNDGGFTSLSSMVKVKTPPEWMFTLDLQQQKAFFESPELVSTSTSKLKQRYAENGAIYFVKLDWLLNKGSLYDSQNHSGYIMHERDSIDIDTPEDWQYAEFLMNA